MPMDICLLIPFLWPDHIMDVYSEVVPIVCSGAYSQISVHRVAAIVFLDPVNSSILSIFNILPNRPCLNKATGAS